LIIVIKAVETAGLNAAESNANLWFAAYGATLVGMLIVAGLLMLASRPALFKRRAAP
jgi:lipopolysaccharide export system permease protein